MKRRGKIGKEIILVENKFCLIKTTFESEEEVINMAKMLLSKKLIVSGQIKNAFFVHVER